jgi:hypothetical protein
MSRSRLLPIGKPISFRLTAAQTYQLRKHELIQDEPVNQLINRQLRRLEDAIAAQTAPPEPLPSEEAKPGNYLFRPELEKVEPFVQAMRKARELESDREAMSLLVPWSNDLEIITPILSAEEAYHYWVKRFGLGTESIPIRSALLAIRDRCSLEQAKKWLWELKGERKVRLRIPDEVKFSETLMRLPDSRGKVYFYMDL